MSGYSIDRYSISTPSSIGLECESGNVDDCNSSMTMEVLPFSCKGIFMFSTNKTANCGSKCKLNNANIRTSNNVIPYREGWTKWVRYNNNSMLTENIFLFKS